MILSSLFNPIEIMSMPFSSIVIANTMHILSNGVVVIGIYVVKYTNIVIIAILVITSLINCMTGKLYNIRRYHRRKISAIKFNAQRIMSTTLGEYPLFRKRKAIGRFNIIINDISS